MSLLGMTVVGRWQFFPTSVPESDQQRPEMVDEAMLARLRSAFAVPAACAACATQGKQTPHQATFLHVEWRDGAPHMETVGSYCLAHYQPLSTALNDAVYAAPEQLPKRFQLESADAATPDQQARSFADDDDDDEPPACDLAFHRADADEVTHHLWSASVDSQTPSFVSLNLAHRYCSTHWPAVRSAIQRSTADSIHKMEKARQALAASWGSAPAGAM